MSIFIEKNRYNGYSDVVDSAFECPPSKSRTPSKALIVFLSKTLYPHCSEMIGSKKDSMWFAGFTKIY